MNFSKRILILIRRLVSRPSLLLLSHVVSFAASLIAASLFARQLPIEEYAQFALFLAAVLLLSSIGSLGIPPFIIRSVKSIGFGRVEEISGVIAVSIAFYSLLSATLFAFSQTYWGLVAAAAGSIVVSTFMQSVARAKERVMSYALSICLPAVFSILAMISLELEHTHLVYSTMYTVGLILTAIAMVANNYDYILIRRVNFKVFFSLFVLTIPIMLSNITPDLQNFLIRVYLEAQEKLHILSTVAFNQEIFFKLSSIFLLIGKVIVFPHVVTGTHDQQMVRLRKLAQILPWAYMAAVIAAGIATYLLYDAIVGLMGVADARANVAFGALFSVLGVNVVFGYFILIGYVVLGRTSYVLFFSLGSLFVSALLLVLFAYDQWLVIAYFTLGPMVANILSYLTMVRLMRNSSGDGDPDAMID